MSKTNVWEYDETKELLNVMVEQNSLQLLNEKKNTHSEIYKNIEAELKKRGYTNKNNQQIENRWRNLKNRYNMVKNMHIENGNERSVCPFYDELNRMLEQSKASIKNGVSEDDSCNKVHTKRMREEYEKIEKRMPTKRNIWEYDETKELLSIMVEQESLKHFNGKHYKNAEIYKKIEAELKRRGFANKNDKQIANRWKNMKKEYCKVKRMNKNSNEIILCPFFEEIDSMINNRIPSNSTTGDTKTSKNIFIEENGEDLFLEESSSVSSEEEAMFEPKFSKKEDSSTSNTTKCINGLRLKKKMYKSTYRTKNKFCTRIKKNRELAKQFFEDQKRLIDYEFSLYLKHEKQLQKHLEETTKRMLEENTKNFLEGLKSLLHKTSADSNINLPTEVSY